MSDTPANGSRVLVVEDDASLQYALRELFTRDGFQVRVTSLGSEGAEALRSFDPDLVILDLGLPDMNGFDLLREVRRVSSVPVLVLSGRETESDRVLALELGADDYVVKPFLSRELVARVRARLRRDTVDHRRPEAIGDDGLVIDPSSRDVTVDGASVTLTAKEFDLLAHLASSPRQVFSRGQLLQAVWNSSSDWQDDSTVTEHIHRLRQKVGAERIVTVRGAGYRFEPTSSTR